MSTIRLDRATHGQLRSFIAERNLETPPNATNAQLIAVLAASGYTLKTIEIDEGTVVPSSLNRSPADGEGYDYVKIIIARQENPGGDQPVFVGHNGRGMYIPRGEPVIVHRKFYESCLLDAVQTVYPETDRISAESPALANGMETPRFPVQFLSWETHADTPRTAAG